MRYGNLAVIGALGLVGLLVVLPTAHSEPNHAGMHYDSRFQRIATLPNYLGNPDPSTETAAEIVDATPDGRTLVYTDSEQGAVVTVSLQDPASPERQGSIAVEGEPTSVAVRGQNQVLVSVNTSESFSEPSGHLAIVDIGDPAEPSVVRRIDLGGQPDAVAVGPQGRYTAVAIENERNEELCVGGSLHGADVPEDDSEAASECRQAGGLPGGLPQTDFDNPPGYLMILDHQRDRTQQVALTGLAGYAPGDPEPEFVTINADGEAAVSMQENNHIAVVDVASGEVVQDFPAGRATLTAVDTTNDSRIRLNERLEGVPREPDAISWIQRGDGEPLLATANEGDLRGGSRGFSLFGADGGLVFDSGNAFEHRAVRYGHYPEHRSEAKGTEPESVAYSRFGDDEYLFVASERGGFVAVYEMWGTQPRFVQLLPAPLEPEDVLALPDRDLLVVVGEADNPPHGVRSTTMVYRLGEGAPAYPHLISADDAHGRPLSWSALSALAAVPEQGERVLAVEDSYYRPAHLLAIDAGEQPAVITERIRLTGGRERYDLEGVAVAPDGDRWLASEGAAPGGIPNELLRVETSGEITATAKLPPSIRQCRAESEHRSTLDNGFEGVAVEPTGSGYRLLVAQQLPWTYTTERCSGRDDDTGETRVWRYNPDNQRWQSITYELEATPEQASWVGLSEIKRAPDGAWLFIERDNRSGAYAAVKHLVRVPDAALADGRITRAEKSRVDLIPYLKDAQGWISDKPEGLAVREDGHLRLVTDNDGVNGWAGETAFLDLGAYQDLFPGRD
ncbi:esterase-like activity of phytase family protein [Aquisalimonas lutea]|uniref:esterase-like activity of phytase family protein n=1 Tax=Aquisalimonas lutea TaxID=1327750 RepID=UPI0025B3F66C|nr:esterase-like activity of phytase family protein [Aquisalimonas lutea]MDN3517673.1 esterase-like activity of phytase family protein [Aquisalimonas lutea]